MTKSWNIDRLLPEAESTYRQIEQHFGIRIYHPTPLQRYCQNTDDAKRFQRRARNPRYKNAFGPFSPADDGPEAILNPHGRFEILHTAYVDLPQLITTLHSYFAKKGCFRDETFSHEELIKETTHWKYRGLQTQRVIFCEGIGLRENPWFQSLPFSPAKGETLILTSKTLQLPQAIYHHIKWILPYGDQSFRVGATYDESDLSAEPTKHAKQELLHAVHSFIKPEHEFVVQKHLAGIRPSTPDARPLLGQHPNQAGLYILNGLGSKGASVAPEMSRQLIEHLLNDKPLDPEIDIARFS
jgi:glycine/D-amino acid oxidase-like deaminating enzyme